MFQLLNKLEARCLSWSYELSYYVRTISWYEDGPPWGRNAWKPLIHEHNNLEGICGTINESLKLISAISYQAHYVSWRKSKGKLDLRIWLYKNSHFPQQWKEPSSSSNPQSDSTSEEHLKILLRILSTKSLNITSLFHLREYCIYVFHQTETVSIRTQSGRRNYRQSNTILQRAASNPHLLHALSLCRYTQYQIRHALVHYYQVVTLRRIFWRTTVDRRGELVSS